MGCYILCSPVCNVLEVAYKQGVLAMDVLVVKFWENQCNSYGGTDLAQRHTGMQ
jgi:hypothetical protein